MTLALSAFGSSRFDRRRLLLAAGGLACATWPAELPAATAAELAGLDEQLLEVPGERLARRCLLLVPRAPAAVRRLLVLFHGLGETTSEAIGIRAWADRYGLVEAAARLRHPPLERTLADTRLLLPDERLSELNAALARQPFGGMAIACPFTPNVFRQPSTPAALDRYADWLVDGVLPEARKRLALPPGVAAIGVDGVSLGGYVSVEVFLRRPEAFGAVGALQGAFGANLLDWTVRRVREAFDRAGPKPLRIATTSWDPEHGVSEKLAARLRKNDIDARLDLSPGGHDQRFLRELGSLELLLYYDRTLPRARREGRAR